MNAVSTVYCSLTQIAVFLGDSHYSYRLLRLSNQRVVKLNCSNTQSIMIYYDNIIKNKDHSTYSTVHLNGCKDHFLSFVKYLRILLHDILSLSQQNGLYPPRHSIYDMQAQFSSLYQLL